MARMPLPAGPAAAAPAPADAPIDAGIGAQPPIDGGDTGDDTQVLLTVLKGPDGSYVLVQGDEDDGGGDDENLSEDDVAAGAGGAPGGGDAGSGEGQHFDSKGALLKGILDLLNADEGGADDQFSAGFNGDSGGATGGPPGKMAL